MSYNEPRNKPRRYEIGTRVWSSYPDYDLRGREEGQKWKGTVVQDPVPGFAAPMVEVRPDDAGQGRTHILHHDWCWPIEPIEALAEVVDGPP